MLGIRFHNSTRKKYQQWLDDEGTFHESIQSTHRVWGNRT
jgi:hypothetical protein